MLKMLGEKECFLCFFMSFLIMLHFVVICKGKEPLLWTSAEYFLYDWNFILHIQVEFECVTKVSNFTRKWSGDENSYLENKF